MRRRTPRRRCRWFCAIASRTASRWYARNSTSLSGGALPLADAVLLGLGKFKRIREIDFR